MIDSGRTDCLGIRDSRIELLSVGVLDTLSPISWVVTSVRDGDGDGAAWSTVAAAPAAVEAAVTGGLGGVDGRVVAAISGENPAGDDGASASAVAALALLSGSSCPSDPCWFCCCCCLTSGVVSFAGNIDSAQSTYGQEHVVSGARQISTALFISSSLGHRTLAADVGPPGTRNGRWRVEAS